MGQEPTALKEELAKLSHLSDERAKEVVTLTKELSSEKKGAKVWAADKASLLAERDEARAPYLELERVRDADLYKANQALEQATKEKNEALAEEKADKPEWYDDLFLSDGDSSDEEAAEGVEACSSNKNLLIDP
ncbi:hypothetical protein LIER_28703 [Lithospermum erythrorhizon]|uniref:Uncharacterized protein n=1 Tax=Lithospermum erythrorhizon TaxID=34254 RepID=A0AAV3RH27_LITER